MAITITSPMHHAVDQPMAPPAPRAGVDWARLDLSTTALANGHVESTWSAHDGQWTAPTLVKDPYLRIHGLSPALNYGMQAYEGLKATRSAANLVTVFRPVFRPVLHHRRLAHSAAVVSLPAVPQDTFLAAVCLAVRANADLVGPPDSAAMLYLRPVLLVSTPQLALEPASTCTLAVYVQPATTYHGVRPVPCLVLDGFDRAATRGTGSAKVGGNYAPVIRHSQAARGRGFPLTLHLDSRTQTEVEEFSTSGFVGVRAGPGTRGTLVVPRSPCIIDSVTSDSLLALAADMGYRVERRVVKYAELAHFSEVLAVGTAVSVLPVSTIVRESTGDKFEYCWSGEPGPAAVELAAAMTAAIRGPAEDDKDWRYEVVFPDESHAL